MGTISELPSALLRCVNGTSVGDAFGQCFFAPEDEARSWIASRRNPEARWPWTDDTVMTTAVASILSAHGEIDADRLAALLAAQYVSHPLRGYGATARRILLSIHRGVPWQEASGGAFEGMGSMGNGAAMRSAPIGVQLWDDLDVTVANARRAAAVTHAHEEGQAGAIAVAVAAALARRAARHGTPADGTRLLREVIERTPASETRDGLEHAATVPFDLSGRAAASVLGNGSRVCAQDTVPFSVWCAAGHLDDYVEAIWTAVDGLGDRDTTCAIVGGIVMAGAPSRGIPAEWLAAREPLDALDTE